MLHPLQYAGEGGGAHLLACHGGTKGGECGIQGGDGGIQGGDGGIQGGDGGIQGGEGDDHCREHCEEGDALPTALSPLSTTLLQSSILATPTPPLA